MKRFFTSMLAFLMVFSFYSFLMPEKAEAQSEAKIALTINASEKCGATYGKNTAFLEKVEEDGHKALKITPNNVNPESNEIILDFFNLGIDGADIKDVRYIVVNYRYECPPSDRGAGDKMGLLMMPAAGALKSWVNINSVTPIAANNWWTVCVFNVSDFDQKVDPASGKNFYFFSVTFL